MNNTVCPAGTGVVITDKKLREQARILYLGDPDRTIADIAGMLRIPQQELHALVYGVDGSGTSEKCWYSLRKNMSDAAIISVMAEKQDVVRHVGDVALNIIVKTLERINREISTETVNRDGELVPAAKLSVDDLVKISTVFEKMDKIVRLDNGQATEIRAQMELNYDQKRKIARILKNDPFTAEVFEVVDTPDSLKVTQDGEGVDV